MQHHIVSTSVQTLQDPNSRAVARSMRNELNKLTESLPEDSNERKVSCLSTCLFVTCKLHRLIIFIIGF
jgi:hypothetical protein